MLKALGGAFAASSPSQWVFISANTLCFLKRLHSCVLVVRCRLLLFAPVYPYKVLHLLGGRRRREIAKETFDVSLGVGCEAITQQGFRGQIDFPGNLFPAEMRSVGSHIGKPHSFIFGLPRAFHCIHAGFQEPVEVGVQSNLVSRHVFQNSTALSRLPGARVVVNIVSEPRQWPGPLIRWCARLPRS